MLSQERRQVETSLHTGLDRFHECFPGLLMVLPLLSYRSSGGCT